MLFLDVYKRQSVSSQYQANVPQYFLNIDRDKVQFMGIALNDVFSTLGYYMGAAYVNDFCLLYTSFLIVSGWYFISFTGISKNG